MHYSSVGLRGDGSHSNFTIARGGEFYRFGQRFAITGLRGHHFTGAFQRTHRHGTMARHQKRDATNSGTFVLITLHVNGTCQRFVARRTFFNRRRAGRFFYAVLALRFRNFAASGIAVYQFPNSDPTRINNWEEGDFIRLLAVGVRTHFRARHIAHTRTA